MHESVVLKTCMDALVRIATVQKEEIHTQTCEACV